jgi:archaellum component FlaC
MNTCNKCLLLREELKNELKDMKESILLLTYTIEKLAKTTERMDNHINFVEETYDKLKHPLNYISTKIGYIIGKNTKELE